MKNLKNTRKDTQDKWNNLIGNISLTGSKASWMSQYTEVAAQTVGLDLVSIKPLPAPSCQLFYLDYQYGNTKHTTRKRKINNIFKVNE